MYGHQRVLAGSSLLGLVLCLAATAGCGSQHAKVVSGAVTCGSQPVNMGQVRFVPIEETKGPVCLATIADGKYRVDTRGGVPLGTYRVEVMAEKKTGRKVQGRVGLETAMIDEVVRLGPAVYAGSRSPLKLEVTPDFEGIFDINLPSQ